MLLHPFIQTKSLDKLNIEHYLRLSFDFLCFLNSFHLFFLYYININKPVTSFVISYHLLYFLL